MTPEREKYLAKCSKRERILRSCISEYSYEIQKEKYRLTNGGCLIDIDKYKSKLRLKRLKYHLTAYRHELARLKGMDRVVVPRGMGYYRQKGWCVCDIDLERSKHTYCSNCGRKILWR